MLTTRAFTPSLASFSWASSASCNSLPVPIRITSGVPGTSLKTYAPLRRPSALAYLVRSKVGTACRVNARAVGCFVLSIASFHATAVSFASAGRIKPHMGHQAQ